MGAGSGRKALREYLARELAQASQELTSPFDFGEAIPPTYEAVPPGRCYCGLPYFRDEKLCKAHARERLERLWLCHE